MSRIVPNFHTEKLRIIDEYKAAIDKIGEPYTYESFEAYINANIFFLLLSKIEWPLTKEKIIAAAESIKDLNFKGLYLNFNPKTRELSDKVWIDKLYY